MAAAALIGLGGLAAPARAAEIYVDNVQLPYSESLNLNGVVDGSSYNAYNQLAGQIVLTVNNVGNASQFTLPVWCVDIFHDIYLGSSGFQFSDGALSTDNSAGTPNGPAPLSATQITEILDLATYGNTLMRNSPSNHNSALVQAAIWTVEYNNSTGNTLAVTGGDITETEINDAIADALVNGGSGGQLISLDGIQQQVFDGPVPEPASLSLLAVSLFGMGFARRRKSRSLRSKQNGATATTNKTAVTFST
jgi:PEP-CTERM motif